MNRLMLTTALLLIGTASAVSASQGDDRTFARRGADNPPGDVRGGGHPEPGDDRGTRNLDSPSGFILARRGRGADDPPGDDRGGGHPEPGDDRGGRNLDTIAG